MTEELEAKSGVVLPSIDDPEFGLLLDPPTYALEAERRLVSIWRTALESGDLPKRKDFRADLIADLAPRIAFIDVLPRDDGGIDFRYRYFGTELNDLLGDIGHTPLSDCADRAWVARAIKIYETAFRTKGPVLALSHRASGIGKRHLRMRTIVLPLGAGDGTVTLLLGYLEAFSRQSSD